MKKNNRNQDNNFFRELESTVAPLLRWASSIMDRIIFTKYHTLVALILAIVSWFMVNYSDIKQTTVVSSKTVSGVHVVASYNTESFELTGLPTTCDVTISGDIASVTSSASKQGKCIVNLDGYSEGHHTVSLATQGYGDNISISTNPQTVNVTIKRKTTAEFNLGYDYINQNKIDSKYMLSKPDFGQGNETVFIRASQDTLDSIAMVKALIDVSGQTKDFTIEAPLVAYDKNGQVINADITPSKITATVQLSAPSKTVPIKLVTIGEVLNNKSLDSVSMDKQTAVVYGSQEALLKCEYVTISLDLSTLVADTNKIVLPITLTSGISSSDVNMVTVEANIKESVSKTIEVPISYKNNDNGYGAKDASITISTLEVFATENNISQINAQDFSVYIDIKDLDAGTHTLPLYVESKTDVFATYKLEQNEITVTLVEDTTNE